jgi:plasmid stabilization system protein ParE
MSHLRILPAVLDDIAEAADWYDAQLPGLGTRFIDSFYAALPELAQNPLIHRPIYGEFPRILLRPFPYSVYFRLHQDHVVVVLIFHAARNPQTLLKTLRKRASE